MLIDADVWLGPAEHHVCEWPECSIPARPAEHWARDPGVITAGWDTVLGQAVGWIPVCLTCALLAEADRVRTTSNDHFADYEAVPGGNTNPV